MRTKSQRIFAIFLVLIFPMFLSAFVTPATATWHVDLTPENLLYLTSLGLTLLFSYFPPVATWFYTKVTSNGQRIMMFFSLVLATAIIFGLSCTGILTGVNCTRDGALDIVKAFLTSLIINQSVDRISPKTEVRRTGETAQPVG